MEQFPAPFSSQAFAFENRNKELKEKNYNGSFHTRVRGTGHFSASAKNLASYRETLNAGFGKYLSVHGASSQLSSS